MATHLWKKWTYVAILGALSFVLMLIAFPIIPLVPYMKLDFSLVPILLTFILYGRKMGYMTLGLKEILYLIIMGPSLSNIIGVLSDFLATLLFAETFILSLKYSLTKYSQAIINATFLMTLGMTIANWILIIPLYMRFLGMKLTFPLSKIILFGVVPFNLIKGIIVGFIFKIVYLKVKNN